MVRRVTPELSFPLSVTKRLKISTVYTALVRHINVTEKIRVNDNLKMNEKKKKGHDKR